MNGPAAHILYAGQESVLVKEAVIDGHIKAFTIGGEESLQAGGRIHISTSLFEKGTVVHALTLVYPTYL